MMNKIKLRLIVIGTVLILTAIAVWYGLANRNQDLSASPSSIADPETTPLPPMTYEATPSDWTVYDGSELGFKVSHPKDWVIGSCGETCITLADPIDPEMPLIGINITTGSGINDVLTSTQPYIESSGSISFNSLNWTRLVLKEPQTGTVFVSHFAESGNNLYELGLGLIDETTMNIYGEMVRSFKLSK